MPYTTPTGSPFRPLPAGAAQLGFDPVTIATAVSSFASKIRNIGSLFGMENKDKGRIQEAQDALAFAMSNPNDIFPGRSVTAKEWINSQRIAPGGGSKTGRAAYQAAWEQLTKYEQAQVPSVVSPGNTGTVPILTAGVGGGGNMAIPLLIVAAAGAGYWYFTKRRK